MASSKEYLAFLMEQLSGADGISCRPMMGEYLLYVQGRLFGGIYDNRLLVKPTPAAKALLPSAPPTPPYPGAQPLLPVEDVEDAAFLTALVTAMAPELPAPKQRR